MIAIGFPNGMEWLIILLVVLLLFGHRLPGMARSLGSGITEFKRGLKDGAKPGDGTVPPAPPAPPIPPTPTKDGSPR